MTAERETLEVDFLFVGAGPASLAGAYHLHRLIQAHHEAIAAGVVKGEPLGEVSIAVIEKAAELGAHSVSGAILDPIALRELMPDFEGQGAPLASTVTGEDIELTKRLREAGELLGIRVLDHVILGDGKHYSFADAGPW